MSIPYEKEWIQICEAGDMKQFHTLFSSLSIEEKNTLIEFDHYACFHISASNGHHEIVNTIFNYVKSVTNEIPCEEALVPLFLSRNSAGFKAALNHHHMQTVKLILVEEFLFHACIDIIASNPAFIKTIWHSELKNCIFYIFSEHCGRNLLDVKSLLEALPPSAQPLLIEYADDKYPIANITIHSGTPFKTACYFGKLDSLIYLWNLFSSEHQAKTIEKEFSSCFIVAAKNGHLAIMQQLVSWVKKEQKIALLCSEDFNAFIYAADRGYLEIVKFIWQSLPPLLHHEALAASNFAAYRLAKKSNHTSVIAFS